MPDYDEALLFALVLHDIGWITKRPGIGMPALVVGFALQARILLRSRGEAVLDVANQTAIFFWLIGTNIWTVSEFLWEEGTPAGFLREVDVLANLDRGWYPRAMGAANAVMWGVCLSLTAVYLVHWASLSCSRRRGQARMVQGTAPLVLPGGASEAAGVDVDAEPLPCLPVRIYQELFIVPWLIMDTIWQHINYRSTIGKPARGPWLPLGAAAGALAVTLQCEGLRWGARSGSLKGGDAASSLGELLWVLGNVVWMLEDLLVEGGYFPGRCAAVALFAAGDALAVGAMLTGTSREGRHSLGAVRSAAEPAAVALGAREMEPGCLALELSESAQLP
mmetsp:Transcript_98281/g.306023  ORF Transcript_98281/g.306023 Transcript_98281/m.306023 type:complete len:335 (-) Transcript_98281:67-1071(-)